MTAPTPTAATIASAPPIGAPQGPILGHLPLGDFATVVRSAPLVSIDLVVVRNHSQVLLGQRNNRPAQGYWFVPGGRIYKNETMQQAMQRIAESEIGITPDLIQNSLKPQWLGAYEHFYADSFAAQEAASTHYVALAHLLHVPESFEPAHRDAQHQAWRWWPLQQALASSEVHYFSQSYLRDLQHPRVCK